MWPFYHAHPAPGRLRPLSAAAARPTLATAVFVRIALVAAASLVLLSACDGSGDDPSPLRSPSQNDATIVPVTPAAKPDTVPEAAFAIETTTTLGRIIRRAGQDPQAVMTRSLLSATCNADVLVIATSQETIHAALLCDRFWTPEVSVIFIGEEVALILEVAEVRYRVLIETLDGAQAEFTVAGIWVEAP